MMRRETHFSVREIASSAAEHLQPDTYGALQLFSKLGLRMLARKSLLTCPPRRCSSQLITARWTRCCNWSAMLARFTLARFIHKLHDCCINPPPRKFSCPASHFTVTICAAGKISCGTTDPDSWVGPAGMSECVIQVLLLISICFRRHSFHIRKPWVQRLLD